jgi:hypothetical protein
MRPVDHCTLADEKLRERFPNTPDSLDEDDPTF